MELEPILPSPAESRGQSSSATDAETASNSSNKGEKQASSQELAKVMPPPIPTQPVQQVVPDNTATDTPVQDQSQTGSPAIADDVDVIEKEWVDKAKSIVSSTKDNPHMQEKEVSKLQADYLMKRYGKKMKTVE